MYTPTLYFQRTQAEKDDLVLSWQRDDQAFFAAGACHILAYTCLKLYPQANLKIVHLKPTAGYRGNHVYVTDGEWAFDYAGWTKEAELLRETKQAYSEKYQGWNFERVIITDNLETFCDHTQHRLPEHFPFSPWERATKYILTFPTSAPTY